MGPSDPLTLVVGGDALLVPAVDLDIGRVEIHRGTLGGHHVTAGGGQVKFRNWRNLGGGTNEARSRPCSSNCATHAASATSVLRPGTFFMRAALTSNTSKLASSTAKIAESFFLTLKLELIYDDDWHTHSELEFALFEYIEVFYNRQRLHSTINYNIPEQYYRAHGTTLITM